MTWIYLSPHLDDIALSCGGLTWEQNLAGEGVSIWTICAGDPPEAPLSSFTEILHTRWETGIAGPAQRRLEDIASCQVLEVGYRHFSLPDCIYRTVDGVHPYNSNEAIFYPLHPAETWLVDWLSQQLEKLIPPQVDLVCPLTLGGHVDHRLVRAAAERMGRPLWYYADYPYVLRAADDLPQLVGENWEMVTFPVSDEGLVAWQTAIAAHRSQVSSFWADFGTLQTAIRKYRDQHGGVRLWRNHGHT